MTHPVIQGAIDSGACRSAPTRDAVTPKGTQRVFSWSNRGRNPVEAHYLWFGVGVVSVPLPKTCLNCSSCAREDETMGPPDYHGYALRGPHGCPGPSSRYRPAHRCG
jgi:hypothetical protein